MNTLSNLDPFKIVKVEIKFNQCVHSKTGSHIFKNVYCKVKSQTFT